jgi:hypothetical protein
MESWRSSLQEITVELLTVTRLYAASPGTGEVIVTIPASRRPACRNYCCLPNLLVELARSLCAPTQTTRERKNTKLLMLQEAAGEAFARTAERAFIYASTSGPMSNGGHCIYARAQQRTSRKHTPVD